MALRDGLMPGQTETSLMSMARFGSGCCALEE